MAAVMKLMSYAVAPVAAIGFLRIMSRGAPRKHSGKQRPNQKAVAADDLSADERQKLADLLEAEIARV